MADAPEVVTTGKAKWTRLATLGLLLAAGGPLLIVVGSLIWGLEDFTFFFIVSAIPLLGAFFMSRSNTWFKVLGVALGMLICFGLFWTAFGLFVPTSFFDFMPGVLVMPGAFVGIIAGIGAIKATKRAEFTTEPVGGEKKGIRVALTVVIVAAVVSGALTFLTKSTVEEAGADAVVVLSDFEFGEDEISLTAGSTVYVRNDDPVQHTFTVEELDIDVVLGPGSSELIEIPAQAGTFIVFCQPHTSNPEDPTEGDMAATLTVD